MAINLHIFRGTFSLTGPLIDQFVQTALNSSYDFPSNFFPIGSGYHASVLTKHELQSLTADQRHKLDSANPDIDRVYAAGLGGKPSLGVYWIVIIWAAGQRLRKQLGLPSKHFHITISPNDVHEVDKGLASLFPGQFTPVPSIDLLDDCIFTLYCLGQHDLALEYSFRIVLVDPTSAKGFLRIADLWLLRTFHKLAMLAYACAYERTLEPKTKLYCLKKLTECSRDTEWGAVFQEHEKDQLADCKDLSDFLLEPWSVELRNAISSLKLSPSLLIEPRTPLFVPVRKVAGKLEFHKMPRFFRWLIPFHLALMSTPRREDDIAVLGASHLGIHCVLTLTEEEPLNKKWFHGKQITNTFLPVPNFHPPSIEQMDLVMKLFDDDASVPVLIHCGGGKGRAGTVAACYLAAFGFQKPIRNQSHPEMSAQDAIASLRTLRPGSLETSRQEAFVSKWCSVIWSRQSVYPDLPSEPTACPMEIQGSLPSNCDLVMLVGLPGSGKSWFSNCLLSRDAASWHRISQDDSGSRASCETEIGRTPRGKKIILDRCNAAPADRKLWLQLASNWCTAPVCVWFDYAREVCTARAQMRAGHPTLPPGGRVRSAVEQMHKVFGAPELKEGFKAIVVVRSFAAAQEAVLRFAAPVQIYKFPRTPHLINTGAAAADDIHSDVASLASARGTVIITEKIDGANMGISLSSDRSRIVVQNRSHYVNSATHEQFKKLGFWLERHEYDLRRVLDRDPYFPERYILYGEWMYATHSIPYAHLPDYFIAFDLYDRTTQSWADTKTLHALLANTSVKAVPILYEGVMPTETQLCSMIQQQSAFYQGRVEGVYVKLEVDGHIKSRGKVVRSDFIAGNEHWSRGGVRVNLLQGESAIK